MAESLAAGAFDAGGNADQRIDAALGIAADGGFTGKHEGIRLLVGGVHDIGHLRAGGRGVGDHGFEELGGDDDAGAELVAALDDAALEQREFLELDLGAEVAAGDHDDVRLADDGIDVADRLLVLDFGDDLGVSFEGLHRIAQFADMGGVSNERSGDVVRLALDGEGQILVVLFREGGEIQADAGQVDVAAGAHGAGCLAHCRGCGPPPPRRCA